MKSRRKAYRTAQGSWDGGSRAFEDLSLSEAEGEDMCRKPEKEVEGQQGSRCCGVRGEASITEATTGDMWTALATPVGIGEAAQLQVWCGVRS